MKKNYKRGLAMLSVLIMLFSLCGCSALDEMRKGQAFYDENGNILWNGATYKALPYCAYLYCDRDYSSDIYLTETDVPVLLSSTFALEYLYPSTDGLLLSSVYTDSYYCREDKFDALCARLQEPFVPDIVCYSYDLYNEETGEFETRYYTLTQEQVAAVELVTQTVEPMVMGNGWSLDYTWSLWLEECSEDMLLRRNSVDIAASGDTYYLFLYTDEGTLVFTVPEGCNDTFDALVSAYLQANDYYWQQAYEPTGPYSI